MRNGLALAAAAVLVAIVLPGALHAAPPLLTVIPSGNAVASIVMKVNGLERARCIWDGSTITASTPDPACTYAGPIVPGDSVRVESFPPPEASLDYLACPTTPYGPRGNFCEFTVASGIPGPFEANVPATVEVRFEDASMLTVQKTGNGQGTVAGAPSGISCGSACTASLPSGTSVMLTATAAAGSTFTGFTGCTAGAANPTQCTLVLSGTTLVQANFALLASLSVTLAGSGSGTVVSVPPGVECGAPGGMCSASLATGDEVQLTADPSPGSLFSGFTGCAAVSGNVCSVTISAATAVTAAFELAGVQAGVTGWKTTKSGRARTTRVTIDADQAVDVVVTIRRKGTIVASRTVKGLQPGTRAVRLKIPRAARAGKASLRVVLTNAAGTSKTRAGRIRIPAR